MKWALALMFAPTIGLANPFCTSLEDFVASALGDSEPRFDLSDAVVSPACSRTLELGGIIAVTCGWAYSYRSDAALGTFAMLLNDVEACGKAIVGDESLVSHPDSYDLRLFAVGSAEISVSLKDKGALQQTWVFLRAGTN